MPNYEFQCPNCEHKEEIFMKMSEMTNNGHMCPECNTEMKRTVASMVCGSSVDKTGDFYRKVN